MRIVVDLQGAQTESRYRGIGRYSLSLTKEIARRGHARGHQVWVIGNNSLPVSAQDLHDALDGAVPLHDIKMFSPVTTASWDKAENAWRRAASELVRETFIRQLQPDVVVISSLFEGGSDNAVTSVDRLGAASIPTCVVLYDLIPMSAPEKYLGTGWPHGWYHEKIAHLQRARLLLSISQHSKDEAHEMLGVVPERIVNMSSACDAIFRPVSMSAQEAAALRVRHGLQGDFLLCTGAMDERKNITRLVHAYAALPSSLVDTYQLALAGKWNAAEEDAIGKLAMSLRVGNRVVVLRHVSDPELVQLLNQATLFVFPSLQEGFGLPPLEAMACGTATISSHATSLREVVGYDEAMFDPNDTAEMTALMQRALTDKSFRTTLEQYAGERAALFSWARTADIALDSLEQFTAKQPAASSSPWAEVAASRQDDLRTLLA
ncbi:MAG: glycosyltransferase family 1 protein, partial [Alcaligenaceae bacterium]